MHTAQSVPRLRAFSGREGASMQHLRKIPRAPNAVSSTSRHQKPIVLSITRRTETMSTLAGDIHIGGQLRIVQIYRKINRDVRLR